MDDAVTPPSGPPQPLSSLEGLRNVWDRFRTGEAAACPNDGTPLALSVDGSGGVYRFVCMQCGTASTWFESGPAGMALRLGAAHAALEEDREA